MIRQGNNDAYSALNSFSTVSFCVAGTEALIQAFIAKSPVKAFDERILHRFTWIDKVQRHFRVNVTQKLMVGSNTALFIKSLFLLKVVPEVVDPVIGSFQRGCIERQIRTIEATNIRMMNLLLVIHPSIG